MIAIIDYGAGNLRSVKKAFDFLGVDNRIVSSSKDFKGVDRVVLPGVGAFGAAMDKLSCSGLIPVIKEYIDQGLPFLGICLGMQLLLSGSEEDSGVAGLSIFSGTNRRFNMGKVPQIGWNQVEIVGDSLLLSGLENQSYFYFIHGFYVQPQDQTIGSGLTEYYQKYISVIESGNIRAVQFHPEKSGENGLQLLRNWVRKC